MSNTTVSNKYWCPAVSNIDVQQQQILMAKRESAKPWIPTTTNYEYYMEVRPGHADPTPPEPASLHTHIILKRDALSLFNRLCY